MSTGPFGSRIGWKPASSGSTAGWSEILRTPFGGVKQSGLGREGGEDALRFFTETKNVCVQYGLRA